MDAAELIHHLGAISRYAPQAGPNRSHLPELQLAAVAESIGSVRDAYENARAESARGLCKSD